MKQIEAVIFDWAGTTVDFGCFAPVAAFRQAFREMGLSPTAEETRAPMGLPKRDHVARMLAGERLKGEFETLYGRSPTGRDVDEIYRQFEPALFATLESYADPLPGVLETVALLEEQGVKTGSTTGYTAAMMEVVTGEAARRGYRPGCMVCPDDVEGVGRPYPYMLWRNLQMLEVQDVRRVVKVGDTAADIREGLHAGCISVGVLLGSSMLGLSEEEAAAMDGEVLAEKLEAARNRYRQEGAHAVIDSIKELPELLERWEDQPANHLQAV